MTTIEILFMMFIGMAGGLAVGSGFVAFLTVLGVIPRLTQLTKTMKYIRAYEWSVIAGAACSSFVGLADYTFRFSSIVLIFVGLACGIFIGMLAAALTEVLNVFPILAKRIGIDEKILILLHAIVLGKVFGSLFYWLIFVDL